MPNYLLPLHTHKIVPVYTPVHKKETKVNCFLFICNKSQSSVYLFPLPGMFSLLNSHDGTSIDSFFLKIYLKYHPITSVKYALFFYFKCIFPIAIIFKRSMHICGQQLHEKMLNIAQSCQTLSNPMDCSLPALLSMGFSRQEYWSGLPFSSPWNFATQGSNPGLPHCRQMLYRLNHHKLQS